MAVHTHTQIQNCDVVVGMWKINELQTSPDASSNSKFMFIKLVVTDRIVVRIQNDLTFILWRAF